MLGVNPKQIHKYYPMCEREKPIHERTYFEIRTMTAKSREIMENAMAGQGHRGVEVYMGSAFLGIIRSGLVGWGNFKVPHPDEPDELIEPPFKTEPDRVEKKLMVPTLDTLSYIPASIRKEIADVIEAERFTELDLGNFESPSELPSEKSPKPATNAE